MYWALVPRKTVMAVRADHPPRTGAPRRRRWRAASTWTSTTVDDVLDVVVDSGSVVVVDSGSVVVVDSGTVVVVDSGSVVVVDSGSVVVDAPLVVVDELGGFVVVVASTALSAASAVTGPTCSVVDVASARAAAARFSARVAAVVSGLSSGSTPLSAGSGRWNDGGSKWADTAGSSVRAGSGSIWAPARLLMATTAAATPAMTRALRRATACADAAARRRCASAAASAMCRPRTSGRGGALTVRRSDSSSGGGSGSGPSPCSDDLQVMTLQSPTGEGGRIRPRRWPPAMRPAPVGGGGRPGPGGRAP